MSSELFQTHAEHHVLDPTSDSEPLRPESGQGHDHHSEDGCPHPGLSESVTPTAWMASVTTFICLNHETHKSDSLIELGQGQVRVLANILSDS